MNKQASLLTTSGLGGPPHPPRPAPESARPRLKKTPAASSTNSYITTFQLRASWKFNRISGANDSLCGSLWRRKIELNLGIRVKMGSPQFAG